MLIFFEALGFLFIFSTSMLFHYVDDLVKPNKFTDLLSINNDSIWENLKVVILPTILWTFIELPAIFKNNNLLIAKTSQILVSIALIFAIYYSARAIIKKDNKALKLISVFIATAVGALVSYLILSINTILVINTYITICILVGYIIIYILLTYIPPKIKLFKDNKKNIYGKE